MKRNRKTQSGRRGFTLIELLVVIAMITIMTGFAITNVKKFSMNFYVASGSKTFIQNLAAAQAEAVNGDSHVAVYLDTANDRYQFWRSNLVENADGVMVDGPFTAFNPVTGTELTPSDPGYWTYLDPQRYSLAETNRVSFGDMSIASGSAGGVSGPMICFEPRTGIVHFCQGAGGSLRGSLVLVPEQGYYTKRFDEAWTSSGLLEQGGAARKIVVSRNGDFNECRNIPNTGWDMPICQN